MFIDNKNNKKNKKLILHNLKSKEKSDIFIFYFLFGHVNPSPANILIGAKCNRPALIDNDEFVLSIIKYGDFPFVYYKIPEMDYPIL